VLTLYFGDFQSNLLLIYTILEFLLALFTLYGRIPTYNLHKRHISVLKILWQSQHFLRQYTTSQSKQHW
jgi:hypothetical protein